MRRFLVRVQVEEREKPCGAPPSMAFLLLTRERRSPRRRRSFWDRPEVSPPSGVHRRNPPPSSYARPGFWGRPPARPEFRGRPARGIRFTARVSAPARCDGSGRCRAFWSRGSGGVSGFDPKFLLPPVYIGEILLPPRTLGRSFGAGRLLGRSFGAGRRGASGSRDGCRLGLGVMTPGGVARSLSGRRGRSFWDRPEVSPPSGVHRPNPPSSPSAQPAAVLPGE